MDAVPVVDGRADEKWLDSVLKENALLKKRNKPLTTEFGEVCIRFTDAVLCDARLGFKKFDKLTKAEVCSRVYLHICNNVTKYRSGTTEKPSNWLITIAKNRMIQVVGELLRSEVVSDAVAAVVGSEMLAKMSGIARNAPANRVLSDRVAALAGFQFNRKTKETIFGQVWRDSWYRRDGLTVADRAKKHGRVNAARVAMQCAVHGSVSDELLKLLKDRRNGRT